MKEIKIRLYNLEESGLLSNALPLRCFDVTIDGEKYQNMKRFQLDISEPERNKYGSVNYNDFRVSMQIEPKIDWD